jgi:hypothetical protein
MIRVVITGSAAHGRFPFRVETEDTRLAHPVTGLSATPLLDACKMLVNMGAANANHSVALFDATGEEQPRTRTHVGFAVQPIEYRTVAEIAERVALNDETTATPEAAPPPRHKLQAHPGGKGRAEPARDKPVRLHRKRKPTGSGGRRGQR